MTFLHKLAQRLARMRGAIAVTMLLVACEPPAAPNLTSSAARVQLSPKSSTLLTNQITDLAVVGFTGTGDTAMAMSVKWSVTGGTVLDTSTTRGIHHIHYKSATQPGIYKVVASAQASSAADTATITVNPVPVTSVAVTPATASLQAGQTVQLTATPKDSAGSPLTGRAITWATSSAGLAMVSGSGLVTAVAPGTVTITATSEGRSGTASISVANPVPVATVAVTPASGTLMVGQTVQLTATPKDANGNALSGRVVTWGSSNTAAATVNASGLVTSVAAGSATITATSEGQSGISAITVTLAPVASVSISPASASVRVGQTAQLTATPKDANGNALTGRVVTWGSSNTAVATVNGSGLVTGVAAGSATITATSEGQSGISAISVPVPVASVSVSPASASVTTGQTVQLTATPRDANGNALSGRVVTWGSGNTAVATVNGSGLVTGVAAGSATITATSEGQAGTASITVTVAPVASVTVSPAAMSLNVGQTGQLTAILKDANGNILSGRTITWASNTPGVVMVNASGMVTALAVGAAILTASCEGQSGTTNATVTQQTSGWPNAPAGWTLINDYDTHAINNGGWLNAYAQDNTAPPQSGISVQSDPTAPLSPPGVWQFTFPVGFGGGVSPATEYMTWAGSTDGYFGFWWKASNPWQGHSSGVNKLVEFFDDNSFFGSYFYKMYGGGSGPFHTQVTIESDVPTINYDENQDQTPITLGVWHLCEIVFQRSNGTVRWWMDGKLKGSYSGVHYGGTKFIQAEVYPDWGGTGGTKSETDYQWFDHVHITGH